LSPNVSKDQPLPSHSQTQVSSHNLLTDPPVQDLSHKAINPQVSDKSF